MSCELLDEKENENNEDMLRSLRSSRSISIFTWTREGLQFTNTGKYTHLGTELNINNVTKADAGFYFCTTKARTGKRYFIYIWRCRNHIYPDWTHHLKIIKFIVQSTGDLVSGQIQIQVSFSPKIISLQKSSIKTGQGLIAEITCTVTGEPKPKGTWYKGDEVMIPIRMVFMYF